MKEEQNIDMKRASRFVWDAGDIMITNPDGSEFKWPNEEEEKKDAEKQR